MEKKNLYIIVALIIAISIISASAYAFSHFSSLGRKYRSDMADVIEWLSESHQGQLDIAKAYRNGEISCEEMDRMMQDLLELQMQPEERNVDVAGCYGGLSVIPLLERYLSDAGIALKAMEEEEFEMSDFEIGIRLNSGKIPESMTPLLVSLVRATSASGTYSSVLKKIHDDDLIFTMDNITLEFNESELGKLSACLLDAAEDGISLVNVECLKIPEDYGVTDLTFDVFGFYPLFDVDTENQIYRESYIKMHQDMLDNLISKLDVLANAEGLYEEGKYMNSIVESSLVLSDVFIAEFLGCNTTKTRETFNACLNLTIS